MTRCVEHVQCHPFDLKLVPLAHAHRHDINTALLPHDCDALGAIPEGTEPRDVISVQVRVHSFDQLEVKLADELEIAINLLQNRIDDQGLPTPPTGEKVGVGPGGLIE